MSDREAHPGFENGPDAGIDPHALDLPPGLVAGLRRELGNAGEVPPYVDLAVLSAFESRRRASATRRGAWKFAAVAASLALVIWVGSANWPTKPAASPNANPAIASGNILGALAAESTSKPASTTATSTLSLTDRVASNLASPGAPLPGSSAAPDAAGRPGEPPVASDFAMVDADGDGRVNILDAMRIAKTVQAVRFARDFRAKADAAGTNVALDQAKMAFFVSSLDVTWDLTADGVVDQKDAELLTARIVRVGNGGA